MGLRARKREGGRQNGADGQRDSNGPESVSVNLSGSNDSNDSNGTERAEIASPDELRRCDHCGQPDTAADPLSAWVWPGRPDGIRLHRKCRDAWEAGKEWPFPGSGWRPLGGGQGWQF